MAAIYRHRQFTSSTLSHKGSMISFLSLDSLDDLPDLDESHSLYSLDEEISTPASDHSRFSFVNSFPMPPSAVTSPTSTHSNNSNLHTSTRSRCILSPRIQNTLRLQRSNPEFSSTRPLRLKTSFSDLTRNNGSNIVVVHPASPLLLKGVATTTRPSSSTPLKASFVGARNGINQSSSAATQPPGRPKRDPRRLNTSSITPKEDEISQTVPVLSETNPLPPTSNQSARTHHHHKSEPSTDNSLSSSTSTSASSLERNRYIAVRQDDNTQLDHRVLSDSKSVQLSLMLLMMERSRTEISRRAPSTPKRRRPLFVYGHMADPLLLSLILKVNPSHHKRTSSAGSTSTSTSISSSSSGSSQPPHPTSVHSSAAPRASTSSSTSAAAVPVPGQPPRISHGSRIPALLSGYEKRVITSCNFTTIVKPSSDVSQPLPDGPTFSPLDDKSELVQGILLYDLDVNQRRRIKRFYPKIEGPVDATEGLGEPRSRKSSESNSTTTTTTTTTGEMTTESGLIDLFKRTTVEVVLSDGLAVEADAFVWNVDAFGDNPGLIRPPAVVNDDEDGAQGGSKISEWDSKTFKRKSLDTFLSVFGPDDFA